jgi:hypothetical protein
MGYLQLFLLVTLHIIALSNNESLINAVAQRCLDKLDLDLFKNVHHDIQFWQTWSHLEFVPLLLKS